MGRPRSEPQSTKQRYKAGIATRCGTRRTFRYGCLGAESWGEKLKRNDCGRNEEDDRAGHPHDRPGYYLVVQWIRSPQSRGRPVGRVQNPVVKGQKRCETRILKIGQDQVWDHRPARPDRAAWPRLDKVPPEQEPGEQKAEMFELMPSRRTECEFIKERQMPQNIGRSECDPGDSRIQQETADPLERSPDQKRSDYFACESARKARENRQVRRSEKDQWRSDHHQKEMLDHVDLQQQPAESIQW